MFSTVPKAAFLAAALLLASPFPPARAGGSDLFAKSEYAAVLQELLHSQYLQPATREMYRKFLANRTVWVGGAPACRFAFKVFGTASAGKAYPLYISLHGGGRTAPAENDSQWQNQIDLYDLPFGIYLAPRAPWDDWDMWFREPVDRIIEEFIKVFSCSDYPIDRNRVYLLGYSAGGDGVWRLAARMPDAFAAASMMAGHPGDVSLVNLYNLPFMIWIGEHDEAYGRSRECARRIQELAGLRSRSGNQGYEFSGRIVKGKGHWMDREDRAAIPWMGRFVRNPHPRHVVWRQEEVLRGHMYQLEVDVREARRGYEAIVDFDYAGNAITVVKSDYATLFINVNDDMFDMDRGIKVYTASGKLIFDGIVPRSRSQLLHSLHVYGGIYGEYPGQIAVAKAMLD